MSGIAGIIHFDGRPADRGKIEAMTRAMAHRGPDGIKHWIKGPVALGQCMLRTTPESLEETQPLANEDASLVLVVDGCLSNWEELRSELISSGARLRTRADAELLLRAYETWGEDCVHHIDGDFAFAIWDERKRQAFCARDRLGVKPFYYVKTDAFFSFASDEEAWLGIADIPCEANEDRIACLLVREFDGYDFDASWLKHVFKLPPAHIARATPEGNVTFKRYWQFLPGSEHHFSSDAECEEAFRAIFREAIRSKMRCVGSPTLMLSGGIDSASVAGGARRIQSADRPLKTYSVIADDAAPCPELTNILAISKGWEQHARFVRVPGLDGPITADDIAAAALDNAHPVNNSIVLPGMMYLAAARDGHRMMCDGVDGDIATYTPIRYQWRLMHAGDWRAGLAECWAASRNNTYMKHLSPLTILAFNGWDLVSTRTTRQLKDRIRSLIRREQPCAESLIDSGFARRIALADKLRQFKEGGPELRTLSDQEQHIRALIPVNLARGMEGFDRVAALHGIEARHPWADRRLLEYYVRLPMRFKVRNGWTKYLVRKATSPWLEPSVRWHRGKGHLGPRLTERLMSHKKQEIFEALRGPPGTQIKEYVDGGRLAGMLDRWRAGPISGNEIQELFDTATLAMWLRRLRRMGGGGIDVSPARVISES